MEIDRVEEWRRLKDQYAAMSDGELEAIANDGWELTDVAQQALQGEISSRGLKVQLKAAPSPAPEPADAAAGLGRADLELLVVQQVWDLSEARRVEESTRCRGHSFHPFGTSPACSFGLRLLPDFAIWGRISGRIAIPSAPAAWERTLNLPGFTGNP